jgi:uncharacterized protein YhfF
MQPQIAASKYGTLTITHIAQEKCEGDGCLAYWRAARPENLSGRCRALGKSLSMEMPIVCERFSVVFPDPE